MASVLALGGVLLAVGPTWGHLTGVSHTELEVRGDTLYLRIAVDPVGLTAALVAQGRLPDTSRTPPAADALALIGGGTHLAADGRPLRLEPLGSSVAPDAAGNDYLVLHFRALAEGRPESLEVRLAFPSAMGADHRSLARIRLPGQPLRQDVFAADRPERRYPLYRRLDLWERLRTRLLDLLD